MKCPEPEPHAPHWHTVAAGDIVVAGGQCYGEGRQSRAERAEAARSGTWYDEPEFTLWPEGEEPEARKCGWFEK